eukprot:CAMPEP_0197196228 /NCGR_PEP_ID=MMETSP1423-20130617/32241_1 /TAXON_ID=476441 /ORGANISM="Pseudo-nitzschia heimii, Strain UNC1101" /LENGTH=288 /DNA_ID=CAMNT_0042650007 /DNA_START=542 /DNA_END=1411 /DNA_ORIENTATION=-
MPLPSLWPFSSASASASASSSSLREPLLSDRSPLRCKVVILGDAGVGKTSLAVRFVRGAFRTFEATTGGTFLTRTLRREDLDDDDEAGDDVGCVVVTSSAAVRFGIWDTAGGVRYRPTAPLYYKGATAAIVVYDVTDPASLESAKSWIDELSNRDDDDDDDDDDDGGNLVLALAGNKVDLLTTAADDDQCRMAALEDAEAYASERGILHLRTSAKTARNVRNLFVALVRRLPVPEEPPPPEDENDYDYDDEEEDELRSSARAAWCCLRCPRRVDDERSIEGSSTGTVQ